MYAKRTDGNHAGIRDGLRKIGYKVKDHSKCGHGVPDLCVKVIPGYSLHLEIKDPTKPKADQELSEAEKEWWDYNSSITRVVFTLEDAIDVLREYKAELLCRLKLQG